MARILDSGEALGLHPNKEGSGGVNEPNRYVTFVDVLGSVHSVIVHPDHPETDPQKLAQAYEDGTLEYLPEKPSPDDAGAQQSTGSNY